MNSQLILQPRKSKMMLNEVYFWTNTIKDWQHLLLNNDYKQLVINSWKDLAEKKLINDYAFVIMPNHLHAIWEIIAKNGREMPNASFNKATGHLIVKDLKQNNQSLLLKLKVNERERQYRVWQRDSLAVHLYSRHIVEQKLDYLHSNPLQEHWNLADRPENYFWSSACFYEKGVNDFGFLTHYRDRF